MTKFSNNSNSTYVPVAFSSLLTSEASATIEDRHLHTCHRWKRHLPEPGETIAGYLYRSPICDGEISTTSYNESLQIAAVMQDCETNFGHSFEIYNGALRCRKCGFRGYSRSLVPFNENDSISLRTYTLIHLGTLLLVLSVLCSVVGTTWIEAIALFGTVLCIPVIIVYFTQPVYRRILK